MKDKRRTTTEKRYEGFTEDERAAMRERVRESRRPARGAHPDGESEVLAKIAELPEPDRVMAERVHAIVKASAPSLSPRMWYGMPAYAKDGNTVCFFQSAHKFKSRYAMLGFSDKAKLDEGDMWPCYYALRRLGRSEEARIADLLNKAVS